MKICLSCIWLLLAACLPSSDAIADIEVQSATQRIENDLYVIDAKVRYELSKTALKALDNGVPLTIIVEISVEKSRDYLWDEQILGVRQRYRLEHHALSNQYILTALETRTRRNFPSLEDALESLGNIKSLPIGEVEKLNGGGPYLMRLRCKLDISELPHPLRPIAYLSPQWRLASHWYEWKIDP
jgi:hypothetical protein